MKNLLILLFITLISCYSVQSIEQSLFQPSTTLNSNSNLNSFKEWTIKYNKIYSSEEEFTYRQSVYVKNLKLVEALNSDEEDFAEYELNEFSDMTSQEFESTMMMGELKYTPTIESTPSLIEMLNELKDDNNYILPNEWDWREKGAVTRVKDQSSCGSCWAFSIAGTVEGTWKVKGNSLVELSEAQVYLCDHGNCACHGGWPYTAMKHYVAEKAGGLTTEEIYPYESPPYGDCYACEHNQTFCGWDPDDPPFCNCECEMEGKPIEAIVSDAYKFPESEDDMQIGLHELGPLSVCMDASFLQFYKKGIHKPRFCSKKSINHAMTLVGWGVETKKSKEIPFWIIKNSWKDKWGEDGYLRLIRGENKCAITKHTVAAKH